jgi:hypothetical protein
MSIAAAQWATFARDVAQSERLWTVRDKNGFPAPLTAWISPSVGLLDSVYFTSLGISWAATICHVPLRLSQVSVQVSLTVCFRPSDSVRIALSLPYKTAMASPKKCTFTLNMVQPSSVRFPLTASARACFLE